MSTKHVVVRFTLSFVVLVISLLAAPSLFAQDFVIPEPPPLPNPFDYRIVYLSADPEGLAAPSELNQVLGALSARTWSEVEALNAEAPIDALIIHNSAIQELNREWVSNAYWRGVVIAMIDVHSNQVAELVNNPCITRNNFNTEGSPGSFFVVVSQTVLADNPDDAARIMEANRSSCGETPASNVAGFAVGTVQRASYSLQTSEDLTLFASVVADHLQDIAEIQHQFTATVRIGIATNP